MLPNTPRRVFELVGVNSFYCSCERIFRPELRTRSVVVLSNSTDASWSEPMEPQARGNVTNGFARSDLKLPADMYTKVNYLWLLKISTGCCGSFSAGHGHEACRSSPRQMAGQVNAMTHTFFIPVIATVFQV